MLEDQRIQQLIGALNTYFGANISDVESLATYIAMNINETENEYIVQLVGAYMMLLNDSEVIQVAIDTIMSAAPVFQSTEGGFGFIFTSDEIDLENPESIDFSSFSLHDNGEDLFKGDYVGIYYLGMGITLGYYDTASN